MASRKNALEDVSATSLEIHAQNFPSATEKNVIPKFPNRRSWTLYKICKYKDFLWLSFPVYEQHPKTCTEKYLSKKAARLQSKTQTFSYQ